MLQRTTLSTMLASAVAVAGVTATSLARPAVSGSENASTSAEQAQHAGVSYHRQ